jgi:type IV pilus assembly protein PilW
VIIVGNRRHADLEMRSAGARQRGLSLIELMVSLVIGLLILAALVALFVSTSGGNRQMAQANNLIENGRLAIELLESDIIHAGYWGGHMPTFDDQTASAIPTDAPTAVPQPCLAYTTPWTNAHRNNLITIPLAVYDADPGCGLGVGLYPAKVAGTDLLVVRHAERCAAGAAGCEADIPGKLYFQVSRCLTDVTTYLLETDATSAFPLLRRGCATAAEKRKFLSNIYYVANVTTPEGEVIPTLMRSSFDLAGGVLSHRVPEALVEGIQGFRIELGIDNRSKTYLGQPTGTPVDYTQAVNWLDPLTRQIPTNRGDGAPDGAFVSCTTAVPCTVGQLSNVTAVKIYLLVRSREATRGYTDTKTYTLGSTVVGPFNDGFKRHVYVSTVRLPNIAGRRQTP